MIIDLTSRSGCRRSAPGRRQVVAAPQQAWRTETVIRKRAYARRHGLDITQLRTADQLDLALEKVVGSRDFLPGRWIQHARAARRGRGPGQAAGRRLRYRLPGLAVADDDQPPRPGERGRGRRSHGDLPLRGGRQRRAAGHHPAQPATRALLRDQPGRRARPDPGRRRAHRRRDAARVDVRPDPAQGMRGKVLVGEPVNIVQHPDGRPRQIAIRNNLLLSVDDAVSLTYSTRHRAGVLRSAGAERPLGADRLAPQLPDDQRRGRQRRDPDIGHRDPHPGPHRGPDQAGRGGQRGRQPARGVPEAR